NVPRTLAEIRVESYAHYAWPGAFGAAYRRNGTLLAILFTLVIAAAIFGGVQMAPPDRAADFYAIIPHEKMVGAFGVVGAFAALALSIGVVRFWRESGGGSLRMDAVSTAVRDVLSMRY